MKLWAFAAIWFCASFLAAAQEPIIEPTQPVGILVIAPFPVANEGVAWPYEPVQLRAFVMAEFKMNGLIRTRFLIRAAPPQGGDIPVYTVGGEIVSWSPGDRATRILIGMGAGRESADIHYWVTNEKSERLFEHRDTIRAEFAYNAQAGSVGQLARPLALKVVQRVSEDKWQGLVSASH